MVVCRYVCTIFTGQCKYVHKDRGNICGNCGKTFTLITSLGSCNSHYLLNLFTQNSIYSLCFLN